MSEDRYRNKAAIDKAEDKRIIDWVGKREGLKDTDSKQIGSLGFNEENVKNSGFDPSGKRR
jgi:hypothetical protein